MDPAALARWESRLRPVLTRLPAPLAVRLYSRGRRRFLASFVGRPPRPAFLPEGLDRELWGLRFRAPVLNAAGMFKNGEGYATVAAQGAGAYLAGTTTHLPRTGNRRRGVAQPFAPYPRSGAASNWLGLPNLGHAAVARRLAGLERVAGCPVGASVAACPDPAVAGADKLAGLVAGMRLYDEAGVDFLELNESCPNTEAGVAELGALQRRLEHVSAAFLGRRRRRLPVIVKFSCDTEVGQVPVVVDLLLELGFDGINFGNTSTAYDAHRAVVAAAERPLFDFFTATFGGGLSGRLLKRPSLDLAAAAVVQARDRSAAHEFHVVRTGGVEDGEDVRRSLAAGVGLVQWYTGFFERFARRGHDAYRDLYSEIGAVGPEVSRPGRR